MSSEEYKDIKELRSAIFLLLINENEQTPEDKKLTPEELREALERDPNLPFITDGYANTALHYAVKSRDLRKIKILIEFKADPKHPSVIEALCLIENVDHHIFEILGIENDPLSIGELYKEEENFAGLNPMELTKEKHLQPLNIEEEKALNQKAAVIQAQINSNNNIPNDKTGDNNIMLMHLTYELKDLPPLNIDQQKKLNQAYFYNPVIDSLGFYPSSFEVNPKDTVTLIDTNTDLIIGLLTSLLSYCIIEISPN